VNKIKRQTYNLAGFVFLLTVVVYGAALRNEFVNWDDGVYVVENRHIRSLGGEFFKWAFFNFYASNWHPLTWISHALDYSLWGLDPLGHHLTNIILHAVNAFLVVVLAMRLLAAFKERAALSGSRSFLNDRAILIAAGTTGLLFGLHPLHVESVAWVAERKDLLCALFFLLSMMAYVGYADGVSDKAHRAERTGSASCAIHFAFCTNKHYLLAIGFFILALLSKPMAVTLPAVLLILDWRPFHRISSPKVFLQVLMEKIPFAAFSLASSIVTIMAQKSGGALAAFDALPLPVRMMVAAKSITDYLMRMVLPLDLIPFYAYPRAADVSLFHSPYLPAVFFLLAITTLCVVLAKKGEALLPAWGYYVITLVPVLGIVQVGSQAAADRYAYLPGLGPFLLAGLGAAWIAAKTDAVRGRSRRTGIRLLIGALAAASLITLTGLTIRQLSIWRNSVILWTSTIEKAPDAAFPRMMRAVAFKKTGQNERAIEDYAAAISLAPQGFIAYYNLGNIYLQEGRIDDAIELYQRALALKPDYAEGHNNLAAALEEKGLLDQAIEHYRMVVALKPDYAEGHYNLGLAYGEKGLLESAEEQLRTAVALDTENQMFRSELAGIAARMQPTGKGRRGNGP
jgi:tetratricopeptide (TPR) repeat protein